MSENQKEPQYKLRWNEELRDKVMSSAKENNRSINQEIIVRLEESFRDESYLPAEVIETLEKSNTNLERAANLIDRLMSRIEELENKKPTV